MELGDKERRRLDAETFDLLENEDGFRLQVLVEVRNRANRSRRLFLDEMRRSGLITKERHHTLIAQLEISQSLHDSLMLDQTMGEESYEDSIIDVAPVPGSGMPAPISGRSTLVQGSQMGHSHITSDVLGAEEISPSGSEQVSVSDASSITMTPTAGRFEGETALIGAPQGKRNTEPDTRSLSSVSMHPVHASVVARSISYLLGQAEALLRAHEDDPQNTLRIRLIALSYARLSLNIHRIQAGSDESIRMSALCQKIAQTLNAEASTLWQRALLAAMSTLVAPATQSSIATPFAGELTIRGGSASGTLELYRLQVKDGWVVQQPIALELHIKAAPSKRTLSSTLSLNEGWYLAQYSDAGRTASWQQYISSQVSTGINIPASLDAKGDYVFIHAGHAILGDTTGRQQRLEYDVYPIESFYLAPRTVTFAQYLKFLRFINRTQGAQSANRRLPRTAPRGGYRWQDLDLSDESACRTALGTLYEAPVTGVSFHDARAYCHWLNIETGPGHRMPSEVEWEKAVRGSLGTKWSWGDAWHPEHQRAPSPSGILDGTSGLLEWTSSTAEDARYRIARGVTLVDERPLQSESERHFLPEEQVSANVTFRVARSAD